MTSRMVTPVWLRIVTNIDRDENGCWIWQRRLTRGYGYTDIKKRATYVHRVSYEAFVGPIPEGLSLDHLCRVKACCNPAHLEPVTHLENMLRHYHGWHRVNVRHCGKGHEFTPENTYESPSKGWRSCKACKSEARTRRALESRGAK